ncbi:hypothetical protein K6119_02050 [Paracrocinitomix mangrovi]|uniref:hypothetical protein n=1 Tax=Paracrocinitomix mangrovi TaxID=2862509 RepID=UPI001C8DE337|nr:hypothetical protein [Paracrocinitomix mangrovi]UKN02301.1 hypothetical protein K6119_02050 [Paracrocinitomix mangrovi]
MRLAQIARKVQEKPSDIRAFIKKKFDLELDNDPNVKLEDEQVDAILQEFAKEEEEEVVVEAPKKETVVEIPIDESVDIDIDSLKEIAEEEVKDEVVEIPEVKETPVQEETVAETTKEAAPKKVVSIDYDSEGKEVEEDNIGNFQEVEVDREAELISAKVEKLEGLKVVGKIELPEDKLPEPEALPTVDAIENEIDQLDGDVDTSEFPDMLTSTDSEEKEAIFAELDAAMDQPSDTSVKSVVNDASEVIENQEEEEEHSIYKNAKGEYRFTPEQKANRRKSLAEKERREREEAIRNKKKRHYEENVAAKAQTPSKKKKKNNKPSQKEQAKKAKEQAPKGIWQKFIAWLND